MPKQRAPQHVRDYADELRKNYGGMMTISDIAVELGNVALSTAYRFIEGATCYTVNGRRRWMVTDVAKKILECEV